MSDRSSAAGPSKQPSSPHKLRNEAQELHACRSCLGYHYIERCIYILSWKDWLEYHSEHMPSQPVPEYVQDKGADRVNLREHVHEMDDLASGFRHVAVPNTRLKADLMTQSSKDILLDEQKPMVAEQKRQRQEEFARKVKRTGVVDEGSEDELA